MFNKQLLSFLRHTQRSVCVASDGPFEMFVKNKSTMFVRWIHSAVSLIRRDDQEVFVRNKIRVFKPKYKLCVFFSYRGARKSYTFKKVCSHWHPFYTTTYIGDKHALNAFLETLNNWGAQVATARSTVAADMVQTLIFTVVAVFFALYYQYTNKKEESLIDLLYEVVRQKTTLPSVIALALFVAYTVLRLRFKIIVVDDVAGQGFSIEEIHNNFWSFHGLAIKGYRTFLVSSNEGINNCFPDKNPTTRIYMDFMLPDTPTLRLALWEALYDETNKKTIPAEKLKNKKAIPVEKFFCPTEKTIVAAQKALPEHIASSMRLWIWACPSRERRDLIQALLQGSVLTVPQVALLAHLAMLLDLESNPHAREQALFYSPKYTNNNDNLYGIKVPDPTPRRLVLVSALVEYYAAVEELMLLQLFIDALKKGNDDIVREVLRMLPLTESEPTVDHVLSLVSMVKTQLTGLAKQKMNDIQVCWRGHEGKTCKELDDSIINRQRRVSWAALPPPSVDKEGLDILRELYTQLPTQGPPTPTQGQEPHDPNKTAYRIMLQLRKTSVPLYSLVEGLLGDNKNNNEKSNNNKNNNGNKSNLIGNALRLVRAIFSSYNTKK